MSLERMLTLKPVLNEYDMDNLEFHNGFHQAEARGIGEIGDNLARSCYYTHSEKVDDVELRDCREYMIQHFFRTCL
jgi:hypothetical protein